jgi:hypothetical protein
MRSAAFLSSIAVAVAAAFASAAEAQESFRVKLGAKPGDVWTASESTEQKLEVTTKVDQAGNLQELRQSIVGTGAGIVRTEVLEASDGTPTKMRVTFEKAEEKTTVRDLANPGAPPAEQAEPKPYAGKTFTVTFRGPKDATVEPRLGDAEAEKQVINEAHVLNVFPDRAVKPGDRWALDEAVIASLFDLAPEDRGTVSVKLEEVVEVEGVKAARLAVDITLKKTEKGWLKSDLILEGMLVYGLANGLMLSGEIAGPIDMKGEVSGTDPEKGTPFKVEIRGSGEVRFRSTYAYSTAAVTGGTGGARPPVAGGGTTAGGAPAGGGGIGGGTGPATGGGTAGADDWGSGGAAPDLSTPERAYESMLAALRAKDYDAFIRCHTDATRAGISREAFDRTVKKLDEKGPPPVEGFEPITDGSVEVRLKGGAGRWLTRFRNVGGEWRCDHVWAK